MRVVGIILLFAVVLGGVYFASRFGPQRVNTREQMVTTDVAKRTSELEAKSNKLREQFEQITALRPATEEDFAVLSQALQAEEEILRINFGHNRAAFDRIERLRKMQDEHYAKALNEESEAARIAAAKATDRESTLALHRKAWELQERINHDHPRSQYANVLRGVRLKRELDQMEAEPIYQKSVAAERAAQAAQKDNDWNKAVAELETALALQVQLNEDYRSLSYRNPQRITSLEEQLDSLRASDLRSQMQLLEEKVKESTAEGNFQQLTASLEQLIRLQERINRDFPNSRFASKDILKGYLQRREEIRSRNMAELILTQSQEVDSLLRTRNAWKAAEIIASLSVQIDSFVQTFPDSTLLGDELLQKYRFLFVVRSEISPLQDKLYSDLLPLPGSDSMRMFRTEIPQELYQSVMVAANPSRNQGPLLPVDSVNHDEAMMFARRCGWLLGAPVRLPTQEEFRQALGRDRYARLIDQTWNVENAGGVTHQVGTREPNGNGFYDLLGNVSEWLLSGDLARSREAYQIGGSIENTVDQLVDVPVQITNALGRNRHNGFRIVVDTTLLNNAGEPTGK